MRVLMLAPETGFVSRRIIQEASSLADLGAEVDIFPALEMLPEPGNLASGVRLVSRGSSGSRLTEGLARRAKQALKRRAPLLHRLADAAQYTITDRARQIADACSEELRTRAPYDVVFAHDIPVLPLGIRLKGEWGAALIVDLHEIFPEQRDVLGSPQARQYWRRVEAAGLPAADGILCVNEAVEAYVLERYRVTPNHAVVHNAVPYMSEQTRAAAGIHDVYGLPTNTRVAVFAGSLRRHGNLETMVLGFGAARLDGWVLALIGDGPIREDLERLIHSHGLDAGVRLGYRAPQDQLIGVLASGDFGIIPFLPYSRNLEISTPAKLYEYIQARLPILTTPLPLIADVVDREGIGGYFDASSVDRAADGIRRFVSTTLGSITEGRLEAAARRVSWQHEERALRDVVDRATGGRFGLTGRLAMAEGSRGSSPEESPSPPAGVSALRTPPGSSAPGS